MITQARPGPYTFGDFLELVREDQKADLLGGVILMASPESLDHNDLVGWLYVILKSFAEDRQLGRVTINKVAYRLSDRTAPEPDLAFVRTERLSILRKGYVDGPPDLAVEVVSPDSVERDYQHKRDAYEQAGVQEYWIIDPDQRQANFLLNGDEGFTDAQLEGSVFRSRVLPGLALDPGRLWQRPLPPALDTVQSLLAGLEPRQ